MVESSFSLFYSTKDYSVWDKDVISSSINTLVLSLDNIFNIVILTRDGYKTLLLSICSNRLINPALFLIVAALDISKIKDVDLMDINMFKLNIASN